jgi:hypothetical protein
MRIVFRERRRARVCFSPAPYILAVSILCIFQAKRASAQHTQSETNSGVTSKQDTTSSVANTTNPSVQSTAPEHSENKATTKKDERGSTVIVPLPISSPAVGSGIIPVLGYIFRFSANDKLSPPSVVGAAGLITNNGSRGLALGAQLYLKENRYRITVGYVRGELDYNIYGPGPDLGIKLPLGQTGHGYFSEFLFRFRRQFFVGPRFLTGNSSIILKSNTVNSVPIPSDVGLKTTLTAVGLTLTRDTRPNQFYPTGGTLFDFTTDIFSQMLGSKYSFQAYKAVFDYYRALSRKQVLAYNAFFCATGGTPPFYGNCIYGTSNELRGYTAGRYFTRYALASQLEYRLQLPARFGLVAFGGVGGVIPGDNQLLMSSRFLPGGGGGVRFQLSKQFHVNLRADIAQGKDGQTFSLGIGEAF